MTAPIDDVFSIGGTRRVPTPPAPTLAPGRELLPCPFCGEVPTLFQETSGSKWGAVVCCITGPEVRTGYQGVEFWRDEAIAAWNRRLLPTPPADDTTPADDGRTYHDPAAEASARAFVAKVDTYATTMYLSSDTGVPGYAAWILNERDSARAALIAAHAAAVADATGRAEAAERALSTIALQVADYSDDLDDFYDRVSAVVAHLWPLPEADAAAPIDTSAWTEADPPALVNGGPARDALDA